MKLVSVKKSDREGKKYVAEFLMDSGRTKHVHFGATGYKDYTLGATDEQREHYRTRHKKDLETGDPTRAGFLSYYLLWSGRNLQSNIRAFKSRFNL